MAKAGWIAGATLMASVGVWQALAAPAEPGAGVPGNERRAQRSGAPVHSVDGLLQAFKKVNGGQLDVREDQDRGFGVRRLHLTIYPDCTYWIHLLAIDGSLAWVSISYTDSISPESWARVVKALRQVGLWVPAAQAQGAFGYYSFTDAARLANLRRDVAGELGQPARVVVPRNLKSAYDALMSSTSRLVFGRACGVAGTKPAGRVGAEALQKARRVDLLGNILRGPSPEGRVYALQALESLASEGAILSDQDHEAMAKVKALPVLINACSGCMPENLTAAQLLGGLAAAQTKAQANAQPAASDG